MTSQIDENAETHTSPGRRIGALHAYITLPFQSCLAGVPEKRKSSGFLATHETAIVHSLPPSRAPTVSGSVSEHSLSSDNPEDANSEKSVPFSVVQEHDSSFVSEASLGSQAVEDDLDLDPDKGSFFLFRMSYLFVTLVVMLADGLQGKHCYFC